MPSRLLRLSAAAALTLAIAGGSLAVGGAANASTSPATVAAPSTASVRLTDPSWSFPANYGIQLASVLRTPSNAAYYGTPEQLAAKYATGITVKSTIGATVTLFEKNGTEIESKVVPATVGGVANTAGFVSFQQNLDLRSKHSFRIKAKLGKEKAAVSYTVKSLPEAFPSLFAGISL